MGAAPYGPRISQFLWIILQKLANSYVGPPPWMDCAPSYRYSWMRPWEVSKFCSHIKNISFVYFQIPDQRKIRSLKNWTKSGLLMENWLLQWRHLLIPSTCILNRNSHQLGPFHYPCHHRRNPIGMSVHSTALCIVLKCMTLEKNMCGMFWVFLPLFYYTVKKFKTV